MTDIGSITLDNYHGYFDCYINLLSKSFCLVVLLSPEDNPLKTVMLPFKSVLVEFIRIFL